MSDDLIVLQPTPLHPADAISHVAAPDAGGIAVFIGTTRSESHPQMGQLVALEYDAYPQMAEVELRRIVAAARKQWPIARAAVLHRTGRCAVGEASVVVAVSCAHRGEAFDACRYVIDELKKTVPIWKNDHFERGTRWHHDRPA